MKDDHPRPQTPENFVIFGDGLFAVLVDVHPVTNENKLLFRLRPTEGLMFKHNVRREEDPDYDNSQGWYRKAYPDTKCICLNSSPMFNCWFITCDWNGNEAPGEQLFFKELRSKIKFFQDESKTLRIMVLRLHRLLLEMGGNLESVDNMFIDRMERSKKIMGSTNIGGSGQALLGQPSYPDDSGGNE